VIIEGIRDLIIGERSETSIVLTGASIIIVPWLAHAKRKAGLAMNSRLVNAGAAETKLCAWLSVSTFVGLLAYALLGWSDNLTPASE
jgi:divalent metal cation (Fe/Co/Zn/Cd) transporter